LRKIFRPRGWIKHAKKLSTLCVFDKKVHRLGRLRRRWACRGAITDDRHTIENLLAALSPAMKPGTGQPSATGLELARELFRNAGLVEGRILVLTDGIKDVREISDFRNAAFPISIIGIGTESGGTIPINRPNEAPRFLTDEMGRRVLARLNESLLIQAAQQSYGRYSLLTIGDGDLRTTLGTALPTEDASIEVEREFDIWADMGFWLCLPLALLMLVSFRRGLFAAPVAHRHGTRAQLGPGQPRRQFGKPSG
jgi:Ca-activated chloride channel family protein